ncbi:hypothetical protein ACFQ08_27965, partial [Streptosporangium algeriense]
MKVLFPGTAGPEGWPVPGCGCASCSRLSPGHRRPAEIVLDGTVRLPHDLSGAPLPAGYRVLADPGGL